MKLTVTPEAGQGPVDTLADLAALLGRAVETTRATPDGAQKMDGGFAQARLRLSFGGKVKAVEVTW